jgi:phenylalanyl-tRNA synthetase beta subunit
LNAPLFETDEVRIFEIGRVFSSARGKTELSALAIGYGGPKKKVAVELSAVVAFLSERPGVAIFGETKDGVFECALDVLFEKLPAPTSWDINISPALNEKYQAFSLYPFIVRDIALFVPSEISAGEVYELILKEAGNLMVRSWQFDTFEKDGKTSYAFRLVFQSPDRTLTDEEVNKIMDKVTSVLNSKAGWQVR